MPRAEIIGKNGSGRALALHIFSCTEMEGGTVKRTILILVMAALLSACTNTKDLAKTLRYADNKPIGVAKIKFIELEKMKRGKACTLNLFYFIPVYGDGSILTAAENGHINTVELIGETGHWYFPFSTDCTVVFGDKSAIVENGSSTTQ